MSKSHKVTMLGTGLIGLFYTMALHGQRNRDRVEVIYSRSQERADKFATDMGVAHALTDMKAAIEHPATDTVVIGLPNHLHEEAVRLTAAAIVSMVRMTWPCHQLARSSIQFAGSVSTVQPITCALIGWFHRRVMRPAATDKAKAAR